MQQEGFRDGDQRPGPSGRRGAAAQLGAAGGALCRRSGRGHLDLRHSWSDPHPLVEADSLDELRQLGLGESG